MTPRSPRAAALVVSVFVVSVVLFAACSGSRHVSTQATTTTTVRSITTTTMSTTTTTASTTSTTTTVRMPITSAPPATAPPATDPPVTDPPALATPFTASVATVTAGELGASWHPGCPVDPVDLRVATVTYVDFGGSVRTGRLVVNADVVDGVIDVFRQLYEAGFPIHEVKMIVTQAEYDDFETPASTGFSCRDVYNGQGWSQHAYGHAIDINPVENPYVQGGTVTPAAGAAYLDRSDVRPGMATSGGVLVRAFRSIGWGWGASYNDYQHFSTTGA